MSAVLLHTLSLFFLFCCSKKRGKNKGLLGHKGQSRGRVVNPANRREQRCVKSEGAPRRPPRKSKTNGGEDKGNYIEMVQLTVVCGCGQEGHCVLNTQESGIFYLFS